MYMELIYVVVMIGMTCVFIRRYRYFHMNNTPPPPHSPPRARARPIGSAGLNYISLDTLVLHKVL